MKKNVLTGIILVLAMSLALCACGSKDAPAETAAQTTAAVPAAAETEPILGLADFQLSSSTWSSPNGATIHLTATPFGYAEGSSASFVVRLEGEEVANEPCQWDGTHYTASAQLNGADGLCYYVLLTDSKGSAFEIPVCTPTENADETYINLASSLNAYCSLLVEGSTLEDGILTVTAADITVQVPRITDNDQPVTVAETALRVCYEGGIVDDVTDITLEPGDNAGSYALHLENIIFELPEKEEDHQLTLELWVELSNGQQLRTSGGILYLSNGELITAVG